MLLLIVFYRISLLIISCQNFISQISFCEIVRLHVQNNIFVSFDAGRSTALLRLDLSAAFDTIDQNVLLHRLQNWFGFSSTALNLLSSSLSGRSETVAISKLKSQPNLLEYGVPQGSVLGPLLYSLYTTLFCNIQPSWYSV